MRILVLGDFQGVFPEKLKRRLKKEKFDFVIGVGDYGGIKDWRPYLFKMFKISKNEDRYLSAEEYFGEKRLKKLMKKDEKYTRKVLRELNNLGKKVVFVFGNSDDEWYDYPFGDKNNGKKSRKNFVKRLKNLRNITYSRTNINGLKIAGFGGYMDVAANYSKKRDEDKERFERRMKRISESKKTLFSLLNGKTDILVLHYPPKGVFDIIQNKNNPYNGKSAGIEDFRKAILKRKPKLVLVGHMHEYQGSKRLGKSLIVNPGDAEKGKYAIVEWPSLKVKVVR